MSADALRADAGTYVSELAHGQRLAMQVGTRLGFDPAGPAFRRRGVWWMYVDGLGEVSVPELLAGRLELAAEQRAA